MSRPYNNSLVPSTKNYPKIHIDRGSLIKPYVADIRATDIYVHKQTSNWRKIIHDIRHEGLPFILKFVSDLKIPNNANKYYIHLVKAIKYIALLMLHLHRVYLYIYGYFYPYSLMTCDEICDEFSRNYKLSEAVIKSFAWHPNYDRCAVAICNDFIYVYDGPTRIRVLRHNKQEKIVDLAWQPNVKEILVVATQTSIIIWRISESNNYSNSNQLNIMKNNNLINLIGPSSRLIKTEKESSANGSMNKVNGNLSTLNNDTSGVRDGVVNSSSNSITIKNQISNQNFILLENLLPPPIISIQFINDGSKLYACSPNSSKIAILDINNLVYHKNESSSLEKQSDHIKYLRKFGQGITKVAWSPDNKRMALGTTSNFTRVYEAFNWTCNKWSTQNVIQDMIWSRPTGRILLMASKNESALYALPFLDNAQPNDVGGNKSMMKALDLNATARGEFEELVGGCIQSFAWDKEGKRLAISFKDDPESIILYNTVEAPTIEFHQIGVIQSGNKSTPLLMDFHDNFKNGSLLTICWSDGNIQHIPFNYKQPYSHNRTMKNSFIESSDQLSPKTPRSLTNFFYVQSPSKSTSHNP